MWNPETTKGIYFFDYVMGKEKDGWEIIFVDNPKGDGDDISSIYVEIEGVDTEYDFDDDLNTFNTYLKPKYQIIPSSLNEQYNDEWDLGNLGDEWNTRELTVGDYIEPDMWKEHWYTNKLKKKPRRIKNVFEDGGDLYFVIESDKGIFNDSWLKPGFKIVLPLVESEDEWDLGDLGDDWNVTELGVGVILS